MYVGMYVDIANQKREERVRAQKVRRNACGFTSFGRQQPHALACLEVTCCKAYGDFPAASMWLLKCPSSDWARTARVHVSILGSSQFAMRVGARRGCRPFGTYQCQLPLVLRLLRRPMADRELEELDGPRAQKP